jgi:4-amino-4-deoxy-L-arabinose transferase-like glycosyltransferase
MSVPPIGGAERGRWWAEAGLLLALFVAALALRVWLVAGGLPFVEHIDEPAVIEVAIRMVRDGTLNPHTFRYPSLQYDLLAATTKLHVWWGVATGLYRSDQDIPFKNYGVTSAPWLFVWARTLTALLGAATVPALYLLGRRMFDRRAGLLAALLLLFMTFHIRHSRYITVDVPTGLWVTVAMLGAWSVAGGGGWRAYLIGGVAAGLAAGTKYNAGLVALAIAAAHLMRHGRASLGRPLLRLVAAGAAAAAAFLITTPYALLDAPAFLRDLSFNAYHYNQADHGDFVGRWRVEKYAAFFWEESVYPLPMLVLLAGAVPLAMRARRQVALLLVGVVPPLLLLMSYGTHFTRNLLPILPLVALLAGAACAALADLLARRLPRLPAPALLAACGAALLLPHVGATYRHLDYWSRPYSMVAAAQRLQELPQGARIAAELPATLFGGQTAIYPVRRITDHPLAWYRANGFRYLAVNDELRTPADRGAYEQLRAAAATVVAYPPRRSGVQPGPSGAILELPVDPAQLPIHPHPVRFADRLELLGYELAPGDLRPRATPLDGRDERALSPGQPLQINLYWRALAPMDEDYVVFVHVLNEAGERVAQRDLPARFEDYPTSRWQPGEVVVDRADMPLPALPPGAYRLEIGVYDSGAGAPLAVTGPAPPPLTIEIR